MAPPASQARIGPQFRVNTYTTEAQVFPAVAAGPDGRFVVTWHSYVANTPHVLGQRYDASGAPDGPEFLVAANASGREAHSDVAVGADGEFVIVWTRMGVDGYGEDVFARRFDADGTPGPVIAVNAYTTGSQHHASVAIGVDGNFMVVWQDAGRDSSSYGVFGRRFDASGGPLAPDFQVNTYTTGTQYDAAVASDPNGNFVVVWNSMYQDAATGTFGQRYDGLGSAAGGEFRVNAYTPPWVTFPDVVADESTFTVVWAGGTEQYDAAVYGRTYHMATGTPVFGPFLLTGHTAHAFSEPSVASAPGGRLVVSSSRFSAGYQIDVAARIWNAPGGEFLVNSYTTGPQGRPATAHLAGGTFVVVWHGVGPDEHQHGIFGQRFGPDLIFKDDFESGSLAVRKKLAP